MNVRWKPWMRRTLSVAWTVAAFSLLAMTLIPLLAVAALFDATRGKRFVVTRTIVFVFWYLAYELTGILSSAIVGLTSRQYRDDGAARESRFSLALAWTEMIGTLAHSMFALRVRVDGGMPGFGERPVVVLSRYISRWDALLAVQIVSSARGLRWHHIVERQLLWHPFIDIVGSRLPMVFVRRESSLSKRDLAAIRSVARSLGPGDAFFVHVERERFTPGRKARTVARLRDAGRERAAREASWMRHVLPPRLELVDALVDAAPDADVVFLSHHGLEATSTLDRVLRGGLVGRTVHAKLSVVSRLDVPQDREARTAWIMRHWREMDQFVENHQPASRRRAGGPPARAHAAQ